MSSLNEQLRGRAYWRSLEELAQTPEVRRSLEEEFPGYAPEELAGTSRRGFLKVMAASLALAGLSGAGCRRWPEQEVRPHASQPEGTAPGVPQFYATIYESQGAATGVLVKSYDGRPIKIEGNPEHPFSRGAADARAQASVLELYDPDRSRTPLLTTRPAGAGEAPRTVPRSWEHFTASTAEHFAAIRASGGAGLAILSRPASSPTLLRLRRELLAALPQARWHVYEPLHRDDEIAGAILAFGRALRPQYRLDRAEVIGCFDADLLGLHPAQQRHARDWAAGRRGADRGQVNRLYVVESAFTLTGSVADHRLPVRPSRVGVILEAVAAQLGASGAVTAPLDDAERSFALLLARDLQAHRGRAVVAVGADQPPTVHAIAHRINHLLGNLERTIGFTEEPLAELAPAGCGRSIHQLAQELRAGRVTTLLILDGNPVYDAPVDAGFDPAGAFSIHLCGDYNETSARCRWHLPLAHFLEGWGDGRAWDGTYSVQQPLIEPLFGGRSAIELVAMVLGQSEVIARELVRQTARELLPAGDVERGWEQLLHDGVLVGSAWNTVPAGTPAEPAETVAPATQPAGAFELRFVASHGVLDGRHANNGWLQELPDPLTRLTWDNAALLSKADADALGVTTGDIVALRVEPLGRELEIAAYVMPGAARGTVVLPLGYGRTIVGRVGRGVGFNTSLLRGSSPATGSIRRTGRRYELAHTQEHHLIDAVGMWGREKRLGQRHRSGTLLREAVAADFAADPSVLGGHAGHGDHQLFEPPSHFNEPHAWGMAIDMDRCIGCAACVVGCQAENNIPIVGKEQVLNRREMHWLRIDRYFKGDAGSPDVVFAPLGCVHCENAPCEQVCPVAATVHDSEGLNTMVYNRCIGTRYCSNNCPYKVRRFNYFDYQSTEPRGRAAPWMGMPDRQQDQQIDQIKRMIFNPDVTVRMRGVMEKCTYCVQRVQAAKINASLEHSRGERAGDRVADGEVATACQQACPTEAIVFGDLNDPNSEVSRRHHSPRAYVMLEELHLRPRTHYLAKLRNPADRPAARGGEHA